MQIPRSRRPRVLARVLAAGGTTAVPRWVTDPAPGIGEHVAPVPAEVLAAVDAQPTGPRPVLAAADRPRRRAGRAVR